jgi:hypothetical protein
MEHLTKWWMVHSAWILGLVVALWGPFSQYVANSPKFSLFVALGAVVIAKITASPLSEAPAAQNQAASKQAGFARLAVARVVLFTALIFTMVATVACNAYQTAERAHDVVAAVIAVAQADLPSLQATGVFSASEGQAVTNYLTLATNLNGQYGTCLTNANNTTINKKSKFLGCLTTFAAGLSDPKELALLRVMSPKAQQQVQLWVTAASVGISSVIAALGGQAAPAPQVAEVQPDKQSLESFAERIGYSLGAWRGTDGLAVAGR